MWTRERGPGCQCPAGVRDAVWPPRELRRLWWVLRVSLSGDSQPRPQLGDSEALQPPQTQSSPRESRARCKAAASILAQAGRAGAPAGEDGGARPLRARSACSGSRKQGVEGMPARGSARDHGASQFPENGDGEAGGPQRRRPAGRSWSAAPLSVVANWKPAGQSAPSSVCGALGVLQSEDRGPRGGQRALPARAPHRFLGCPTARPVQDSSASCSTRCGRRNRAGDAARGPAEVAAVPPRTTVPLGAAGRLIRGRFSSPAAALLRPRRAPTRAR